MFHLAIADRQVLLCRSYFLHGLVSQLKVAGNADTVNTLANFLADSTQARFVSEFVLPVFEVLTRFDFVRSFFFCFTCQHIRLFSIAHRQILKDYADPRPAAVKKAVDANMAGLQGMVNSVAAATLP